MSIHKILILEKKKELKMKIIEGFSKNQRRLELWIYFSSLNNQFIILRKKVN